MTIKNNQSRYLLIGVIIVSLFTLGIGGFYLIQALQYQNETQISSVEKNDNYFKIRRNATELQRSLYKTLNEAMDAEPVNESLVAKSVSENFVADFFTWTNKLHFNDVGGLQYVHPNIAQSVMSKALEYFYFDMGKYIEDGTISNTLEVVSISSSATEIDYELQPLIYDENYNVTQEQKVVPGYEVELNWTYKESDILAVSTYQKSANIFVVKDDSGIFRIVEVRYEN